MPTVGHAQALFEGGVPQPSPIQKIACHVTFKNKRAALTEEDQTWIVRRGSRMAAKGRPVMGELSHLFAGCTGEQLLTVRLDTRKRACVTALGNETATLPATEAREYARMLDESAGLYQNSWLVRVVVDPFIPPFLGQLVHEARNCLAELEALPTTEVVAAQ